MFITKEQVKGLTLKGGAIERGFLDKEGNPHTIVKITRRAGWYGIRVTEYTPQENQIEGTECGTIDEAVEKFNHFCKLYLPGKKLQEGYTVRIESRPR